MPELEIKADLKKRIEEARPFVPLEPLCLSPHVIFLRPNMVSDSNQWAKLALIVETAAEIWGES